MVEFSPRKKKSGVVRGLFAALGESFISESVQELELGYEGILGDVHAGYLRKSGGREPWYPRGTEMRNERQLSLLDQDELDAVARDLDIHNLPAETIGGNIVLSGIPHFSLLPPRTQLFFEGGVVLRIDGDNAPCKIAGKALAAHFDGREDLMLGFPKTAQHRRGLVAWVERPGVIKPNETVEARIWEQCIYPG